MIQLKETVISGFPNDKCNLPTCIRPYWNVRERLAVDQDDGMLVLGARIIIPQAIRRDIIEDLLQMHQGATKLRQRARLSLYWPGMDNDITNAAKTCDVCVKSLPSHPAETLRPHEKATRPFEQIHADLGEVNGRNYLIMVDQYSGWPHVIPFKDVNTSSSSGDSWNQTFLFSRRSTAEILASSKKMSASFIWNIQVIKIFHGFSRAEMPTVESLGFS